MKSHKLPTYHPPSRPRQGRAVPGRAVGAEMRKTARLGTNKAARTPTRASASSHGSHEWSVGNQWAYARASLPTRSARSRARVPLRSHASSCFPPRFSTRGREKLRFSLRGLIGFNWSLMEVVGRGDAGHRSPVSDIELGCIRGGKLCGLFR